MYEVGIQQQIANFLYLHVTGFYRDIRNWVGTGSPVDTDRGITYFKFINKDYGSAKGVTATATFRFSHLNIYLDYAYMSAKGTTSDPQAAYYDAMEHRAPRIQIINLAWDRQQTLNTRFAYARNNWLFSLIGYIHSGLPYTPTFARGEVAGAGTFTGLRENSERRPLVYNMDLRISKGFNWGITKTEFILNIFNLFDIQNPRSVYSDTGEPNHTLEGINQVDRDRGRVDVELSDVYEYYDNPWNFYPPRFIQLGVRVNL
jgi:hypothetical protein